MFPLSAVRSQRASSPVIDSASRGTLSVMPKALALCFWHSPQWQASRVSGWASISYRTAPHWHPPVMGSFMRWLL